MNFFCKLFLAFQLKTFEFIVKYLKNLQRESSPIPFLPFIGEREGNGEETERERGERETDSKKGRANSRGTFPFTSLVGMMQPIIMYNLNSGYIIS